MLSLDDYNALRQSQTLYDTELETDEGQTTKLEVTTEPELSFISELSNGEVRKVLQVKDRSSTETSIVEGCEEELSTGNNPSETITEDRTIIVLDESDDTHQLAQAAEEMRGEQLADEGLMECWSNGEKVEDGFYIRGVDKLLFHKDNIGRQVVVPKTKVREILERAHDCVWEGHFGSRKTSQRIKSSFVWPGMKKEIKTSCHSCIACQLRRRKTVKGRVPITPVIRPANAFEIMNCDIIGPCEQVSKGYKYVLGLVDQCSRWPDAKTLRTISAEAICEALLDMF